MKIFKSDVSCKSKIVGADLVAGNPINIIKIVDEREVINNNKEEKMNIKFSVLFIVSQLVLGSVGQIMLDATDADYMQDFDGLSASAGSHAWAQDSTLSNQLQN